jgi:TPR repeat protein
VAKTWNGDSGSDRGVIATSRNRIQNFAFSTDGQRLALNFQDQKGTMGLYSVADGKFIAGTSTQSPFGQFDVSSDGRFLVRDASNDDGNKVVLFDSETNTKLEIPILDKTNYSSAQFFDNGWLVVVGKGQRAEFWDARQRRAVGAIATKGEQWEDTALSSPSGKRIGAISTTGALYVWDTSFKLQHSIQLDRHPLEMWLDDSEDIVLVRFPDAMETWSLSRGFRIRTTSVYADKASVSVDLQKRKITVVNRDGTAYRNDLLDNVDQWNSMQSVRQSSEPGLLDYAQAVALDANAAAPAKAAEKWSLHLNRKAESCHELAANPFDPNHTGTGVGFDRIDGPAALKACEAAFKDKPGNGRIAYEYSRVLLKLNRLEESNRALAAAVASNYPMALFEQGIRYLSLPANQAKGVELLKAAVQEGVFAAYAELGQAYFYGKGVVQDRDQAMTLWNTGIDHGDPWSHEFLGTVLSNGERTLDRDQALRHFAIAGILYERNGANATLVAAKRGSLARTLAIDSVIKNMRDAKKEAARR